MSSLTLVSPPRLRPPTSSLYVRDVSGRRLISPCAATVRFVVTALSAPRPGEVNRVGSPASYKCWPVISLTPLANASRRLEEGHRSNGDAAARLERHQQVASPFERLPSILHPVCRRAGTYRPLLINDLAPRATRQLKAPVHLYECCPVGRRGGSWTGPAEPGP